MNYNDAIEQLTLNDYFIWDDFLNAEEIGAVSDDLLKLYEAGAFVKAGTGRGATARDFNTGARSDETFWLEPTALTSAQKLLWARLEELKSAVNEKLFLGLWSFEGQYSRYPAQGHYHKHVDRFSNDDKRTLSVVLYLNRSWMPGDGGELKIYAGGLTDQTAEHAPTAGRLICFLSATVAHEVLSTNKVRYSFAGWCKTRPN